MEGSEQPVLTQTEEQRQHPGINDWVESKALAEEGVRLARERGREGARRTANGEVGR